MKCQHCGKKDATFYMKRTVNGRTESVQLCHGCADALGYAAALRPVNRSFFGDPFALLRSDVWEGLAGGMLTEFPSPVATLEEVRTAAQKSGAEEELLTAEERQSYDLQRRCNALQMQLNSAVAAENYEEAARLRDELCALRQR